MQNLVNIYLEKFKMERHARRRLACVVLLLAAFVSMGVYWQLRLTGAALANEVYCGKTEHTHDDSCYELVLICGQEESEGTSGHTHTEACYETERTLICSLEESEGHTHADACYTKVLTCGLEECEGHTHTDSCTDEEGNLICGLEESEGHTHTDSCYTMELTCGLEESEGHTHTEDCYLTEQVLICGLEECESETGHTHTDVCYEKQLICTLEEHTHTVECLIDETADLESASDWEATLPASLSGNWADDLVAVAKSQLGYTESTANYKRTDDGETIQGYTRYGEWAGNPYGDWDAMFVSFCLHYAGISKEDFPEATGAYAWSVTLKSMGWYTDASEAASAEKPETETEAVSEDTADGTPVAGDLVFFDTAGDGKIDRVGIVIKVDEGNGKLTVIEGDYAEKEEAADAVCKTEYSISDKTIVGYGMVSAAQKSGEADETEGENEEALAEAESEESLIGTESEEDRTGAESEEATDSESESEAETDSALESEAVGESTGAAALVQQTLDVTSDATTITVNGLLPEGASITATPVEVEIEGENVLLAFDISIYYENADGETVVFEPEDGTITVTIASAEITGGSSVYYVPEEGEPEKLDTAEAEDGAVAFDAEHFSVYAVTSSDSVEATGTITSTEGNTITWTIYKDSETGERTLVFSGEGSIPDYTSGTLTPWYSYCSTSGNTLDKLVIEDGITAIGAYAFHQSYVTEVSFPDTLTSIGKYAFCYSRSLTSVVIPDSVTYIGTYAFSYSHLEEIDLGEGVQTIESFAFYATYSGSGITVSLPDSLTSLGADAFNQACAYEVSDTNTNYKVIDGVLYSYDGTTLIDYPKYKVLDTYTVPSEVTTIATGALRYVLYVNSLVIDHAVTFQNSGYSMSNSNYRSIYLADGVVITGNAAFQTDTNLTEIRLPEGTTFTLNVSCLGGDSSLTYLKIPDGTTSIQNQSLSGLTGLETLYYDATSASSIASNVFGGTSGISYDLIVGTNVDTLPAGFTYLVANANTISFEGPNAIYITDGALANAPSPLTGISGWIYVDEYGVVYQLDVDNDTATLLYVPDSYVDGNGETQMLTEYTVPASFTVSGESDSTANATYAVTTVTSNALKYADNLAAITFADASRVTLKSYALANCETLKSVTDSAASTTVTTVEDAEKMGFAAIGTNAFYNTGLTTNTPALSEDTMDGSASISASITSSTITVTVSSGGAGTWTPNTDAGGTVLTTGGYVALTGQEVVVSTTVNNTSGTTQTYRLYMTCTDEDFSVNHGPGTTFTAGGVTITCVQDPNDPCSFYYEFTLSEGETLTLDLTCSYPNGADGGGLTATCAIMETTTAGGVTTVTGTKSTSTEELQIWWKTEKDDYTLAKTNGSQSSVQIKANEDGAYLASGLQYTITLTQDADKNSSKGEDYVTSVEYSDVITLPAGVTWDADVLEAIRNGSYTRSSGNTTTFSVDGTIIVTLAMTANSALALQKAVLSVDDKNQVVLTWTVKNIGTANLANNTFTLTVASEALDITLSSDDPNAEVFTENDNKVSNTVTSKVHYTFSDDVDSTASVTKELTVKEGNVAVSKQSASSVTYFGEDLTYEVSVYNDGATDYTCTSGTLTGSYTYTDTLPDAVYISAANMETMFQEAEEMGTPLTVTISGAVLGVSKTAVDADGSGNTVYLNSGNTSSDTETEGNTITITCERSGTEGAYTYSYKISVTNASGSEVSETSGADLEALLQGIGYGVTRSAIYTCTWTLRDQTTVTSDENKLTIQAGETLTWFILSTIKSTLQYLDDSDWPNEYPNSETVTITNTAAYLYDPAGKQIVKTGSVSKSVKREARIDLAVYDSEGNDLSSAVAASDGEAITYSQTFTHYGDGSYDDLAMVSDLYGSQYLLVPISLNNGNSSITGNIWTASTAGESWPGTGVTTYDADGDGIADYYVLGEGTYTNVAVGTYTKSDGTTGTLTASNISVGINANETDVVLGNTAYTYSGVHTEIDWYFDEMDGENYTINVEYQTLVDYGSQPSYTLGNVVWMNDRTGSRIYATLWGGGTIINYDKEIVTTRQDANDPDQDVVEDDDQSEIGEGETVLYRLTLYSTGDAGATFTLSGTNIADALPETYGTFEWSKANVKITDIVVVPADGTDDSNKVTGYASLEDDSNWSIETSWNGLTSSGQYYIIWDDDVNVTFTGNAAVYIYVELTFPENGVQVATAGGGTETVDQWDNYVAAVGGTTVSNTFYVYRNPATVTHILKEEGSATLTKGVYTLAQSSDSIKEISGNINLYPSGSNRDNYNNEDSAYRYIWYYVEVYNDSYSRLYINDLYDTLPEGFNYVMMGSTGDVRNDGRLMYIYAKSNVGTTVSSSDTSSSHWLVEQETGVTYMSATVTASTLSDGTLVFQISAGDGGTYSIKYDDDLGQYYLDHGESIVFGYICQIGTYAYTEDSATNTIAMSYTDYTEAGGVNVAEDHEVQGKDFSVDGGASTWYNGDTNDGSTTVKNSEQVSYDDGTDNSYWLTSEVTVTRGSIVPGASKSTVGYRYLANSDKTVLTYENSVNAGAVVYWEATLSNSGTVAIYDYSVTDVMPTPYVFAEDVTYSIVSSNGTTSASGTLFSFPDAEDVITLTTDSVVTITYKNEKNADVTADLTVDGSAVTISSVNGEFTVKLSMSGDDVVLEIGFTDTVWSIPEGGYLTLGYASYNPTGEYENKTYLNSVTLTPVLQDFDYAQSGKITSDGTGVYATSPVTVSTGASTSASKTVQQKSTDPAVTYTAAESGAENNSIVLTSQDGIFTYTLSVTNESSTYAMTELVVIDNLPTVGDHMTYDTTDRGSEYAVQLATDPNFTVVITSPTEIDSTYVKSLGTSTAADGSTVYTYLFNGYQSSEPTGGNEPYYTIEYSTISTSEYFTEDDEHGTVTASDQWTNDRAYASSIDTVTAIRVIIKDSSEVIIPAGATVSISFDAQVKPTVTTDPQTGTTTTTYPDPGATAWNNFDYDYTMNMTGSAWLSAMPLEVGVQVPSAPKLEKRLVDLDGNAYTAAEDTAFTFIVYEGSEQTDSNGDSYSSLAELETALNSAGITYKEITVTVEKDHSNSGYISLGGSDWSGWTWTQGNTYTIAEFFSDNTDDTYTFKSWTAANGTSGDTANGTSYTFTYDRDKTLYLTAVNTNTLWKLCLTKVDANIQDANTGAYTKTLEGAVFALYTKNENLKMSDADYQSLTLADLPDQTITIGDGADAVTWYLTAVQTTGTDGTLSFADLSEEEYYLVEVTAPDGYNLDATPISVSRGDSTEVARTVTNSPGFELPESGGPGTWMFTLTGLILSGSAAWMLLYRCRKKRRVFRG
ncbi:MAG: leucine-rich repeat protein [Lachnospiraceae bacterium]|nr:leucine-rich repeat protein [Lachnospiraceae bacterium]